MSEFDISAQTSNVDPADAPAPDSRQVRRAKARRAQKDMFKHIHEEREGRNKRRTGPFGFLNRAQYRKFLSNRCPKDFRTSVAQAIAA